MTQRNSPSTFRSPIPKSPQARESCIDPNHLWDTTFLISVPATRRKASGVHGGTELQNPRWPTKSVREIRPHNRFFRSSDQNDQNTYRQVMCHLLRTDHSARRDEDTDNKWHIRDNERDACVVRLSLGLAMRGFPLLGRRLPFLVVPNCSSVVCSL
jgi:hypothetical protein